jgi:RNA polymerase sigma factor (sigma-70 family)
MTLELVNGPVRRTRDVRRTSLAVLRTQPDDRLVALARAGDEQAFEAIVVRYRRPLLRHAQRLLTEAGAEDAVQQAFLSAWSGMRRGDEVRDLSAWLHRIVHNVALNALRAAGRGEHAELTDSVSAGITTEDEIERRMAMRRTLAGVAALPERQREAVLRVAVQGRSQEEVARALGLSHGAVGQLVMRGRRALRAATASLTPPWLGEWLARIGSEAPSAVTVSKVAAVIAVAGTAATTPVLIEHHGDRPQIVAEAPAARERAAPERRDDSGRAPRGGAPLAPAVSDEPRGGVDARRHDDDSSGEGSGGSGSGRSHGDRSGSSGSGSGGSDSSGSGSSGSDSSGSGSGGSDSTGSGSDGSGSSGSGSDGSGSSGSDSSGSGSSGSGSSGSGSSGSGSSGSGSSGSGSSGSGSSGSGSSGSGSSGSGSSGSGSDDELD